MIDQDQPLSLCGIPKLQGCISRRNRRKRRQDDCPMVDSTSWHGDYEQNPRQLIVHSLPSVF